MRLVLYEKRQPETLAVLLDLWERSVRATHLFLTDADIAAIRPLAAQGLAAVAMLAVMEHDDGKSVGFMGIEDGKLEMLFLDPEYRGQGLGRCMLKCAVNEHNVSRLDVNEQNAQGVGFYTRLGFTVVGRSPTDDMGNPFPILHMAYSIPAVTT